MKNMNEYEIYEYFSFHALFSQFLKHAIAILTFHGFRRLEIINCLNQLICHEVIKRFIDHFQCKRFGRYTKVRGALYPLSFVFLLLATCFLLLNITSALKMFLLFQSTLEHRQEKESYSTVTKEEEKMISDFRF